MKNKTKIISSGVEAQYIDGKKFKRSVLSISFFVPLCEEDAAANALLSAILTRSSKKYDNFTKLNARLKELYGAAVESAVSVEGEFQTVNFVASCLNDKYTNGEAVLSEVSDLLCEMVFSPRMDGELFFSDDFESEKRLLIEDIEAEINDKHKYSMNKLYSLMYKGEAAAISTKGNRETAMALTNDVVVAAWHKLLEKAYVYVCVVAEKSHDEIFDSIAEKFDKLHRNVEKKNITVQHKFSGEVKTEEEHMDVTQGKLALGFSLNCGLSLKDMTTMRIACDIFGGGTYSMLFSHVREQQSLCYYCAARSDYQKATMVVYSGILDENREKAQKSILNELELLKNGGLTEDLLATSKKSQLDALATLTDMPGVMAGWYSMFVFREVNSIDEYINAVKNVKLCDIQEIYNSIKLDTVYYLGGKD